MALNAEPAYVPGTCNIGKKEIRKRLVSGILLFLVTFHISLFFLISPYKFWMLILFVFLPASGTALSFVQAYSKFCVYYGYKRLFNFGDPGSSESVLNDEFVKQDIRKARRLIFVSLFIGFLYSAIVALFSLKNMAMIL